MKERVCPGCGRPLEKLLAAEIVYVEWGKDEEGLPDGEGRVVLSESGGVYGVCAGGHRWKLCGVEKVSEIRKDLC